MFLCAHCARPANSTLFPYTTLFGSIEIVEPATTVGSRMANGVAAPVRPMLTSMRCSIATFCSAGNLNAVAHRGNFRSEEHTSELQPQSKLVCRLPLEKQKHN